MIINMVLLLLYISDIPTINITQVTSSCKLIRGHLTSMWRHSTHQAEAILPLPSLAAALLPSFRLLTSTDLTEVTLVTSSLPRHQLTTSQTSPGPSLSIHHPTLVLLARMAMSSCLCHHALVLHTKMELYSYLCLL